MASEDKTEKIQVLLSTEDLEDLSKKISKKAILTILIYIKSKAKTLQNIN